jgi:hypothetical protein
MTAKASVKKPKSIGRPTKCDSEITDKLCCLIRDGHYAVVACRVVGIEEKTYYNWRNRGADGEEPFFSFLQSIKRAEADAQVYLLAKVTEHANSGKGTWAAFMTIMARRWPHQWGENRVDVRDVKQEQKKIRAEMEALKGASSQA